MRRFLILVEKAGTNFSAYSPDLPGCVATGATLELPIPEPSAVAEYVEVASLALVFGGQGRAAGPEAPRPQAPPLAALPAASAAGAARSKIALTFDDLPVHGRVPPGMSRADIARGIIGALRAAGAPAVYGFVNAKALDGTPDTAEFLRLWRAAGFPLGNHAFSHMDLHTHTVAEFERDVLANEETLRGL